MIALLGKRFRIKVERLSREYLVRRFNNKLAKLIRYTAILIVYIDGRV